MTTMLGMGEFEYTLNNMIDLFHRANRIADTINIEDSPYNKQQYNKLLHKAYSQKHHLLKLYQTQLEKNNDKDTSGFAKVEFIK